MRLNAIDWNAILDKAGTLLQNRLDELATKSAPAPAPAPANAAPLVLVGAFVLAAMFFRKRG